MFDTKIKYWALLYTVPLGRNLDDYETDPLLWHHVSEVYGAKVCYDEGFLKIGFDDNVHYDVFVASKIGKRRPTYGKMKIIVSAFELGGGNLHKIREVVGVDARNDWYGWHTLHICIFQAIFMKKLVYDHDQRRWRLTDEFYAEHAELVEDVENELMEIGLNQKNADLVANDDNAGDEEEDSYE